MYAWYRPVSAAECRHHHSNRRSGQRACSASVKLLRNVYGAVCTITLVNDDQHGSPGGGEIDQYVEPSTLSGALQGAKLTYSVRHRHHGR